MSEWKEVSLKEITKLVIDYRGKTPLKLGGEWSDSGYRALSAKNVKTGIIVAEESIRYVDEDLYRKWMKDEVQRGDILITSEAPFGEVFFWNSDEKIVLSQRLFDVRIKDDVCAQYVYYYMTSYPFQAELRSRASGTTVLGLKQPELLKAKVTLPDYDTQLRIAAQLSEIDDKIAVNRRICENLEAQAQALFKHWFIDFAPFKNGKFVESELGMIPEGWRVGKFTDIFDLGSGGTPKTSEKLYWEDGSIPFFSPKDVNGVYCFDTEKHITEKGLNNCSSSLYSKNTVFITCRGTVGKVAMAAVPMAMNQSNYAILSNKGYSQYFAYLMTVSIVKKLKFKANGAVFDAITSKDFKEQIIIPNLNVVNRFDSIIQPIFDNILNIGFENLRLSTLRDTLLPKLMSGQIKV